ncbi:MAG: hypothetical protein MZV64_36555 [Ignavibacteriales bacterium]|nr:hypothetical protein [Ignavibacteriales bacterium]
MLEDLRNLTSKSEIEPSEFELPAPIPSQSIAVLPFVNMSTDPEQEYFCDEIDRRVDKCIIKYK